MKTRNALAVVWLPLAAVLTSVLLLIAISDRLPAQVATHWGAGGVADGFTDAALLPIISGSLMLLVGGLMAAVAAAARNAPVGGRLVMGLPLGVVTFIGTTISALTVVQIDTTSPPELPGFVIPLALVLGLLGWLAASAISQVETVPRTSAPAPASAARLPLDDGHTVVWSGTTPPARPIPYIAAGVGILATVLGLLAHWSIALILVPVLALLIASTTYRVTAGPGFVQAAGLLFGFPRVRLPLDQVTSATAGTVRAWDFGGWGIRTSLANESAVVTRSGSALVIERTDGAVLRISMDDPETPAAVISTLLDRRSS